MSKIDRKKILESLVHDGLSQTEISVNLKLSRERVRQLLNDYGLYKEYWKLYNVRKLRNCRKCPICGNPTTSNIRKYCKIHQSHIDYPENHLCKICGLPTKDSNRVGGYCGVCSWRIKYYEKRGKKGKCYICGTEGIILSARGVCRTCYFRALHRLINDWTPNRWVKTDFYEKDLELYNEIKEDKKTF